ncbi:MAG: AmmeMemoRadiSam system protein B, partial [Planctomycetota bacterium]|nr:AmmeMemoRadiSam system protein B [Planctomycetota bacterium]
MRKRRHCLIGVGATVFVAGCAIVFVSLLTCRAEEKVRTSPLAGSWYPADKAELAKQLDDFLAKAAPAAPEEAPIALVSPHAGYRFCGPTAAYGFKVVSGREFTRVIVLAPSHNARFKGVCVSSFDAYDTPLGRVTIDRAVSDELLQHTSFSRNEEAETREHAVEMQVPFLQMAVKDLKLVPLIVGQMTAEDYRPVAECIRKHVDDKTLVIASSDFTHYGA